MEYAKATDVYGRTALHHAAQQGYTKVASTLLIAGADPSALDVFHITPLMAAASCNDASHTLEIIGRNLFTIIFSINSSWIFRVILVTNNLVIIVKIMWMHFLEILNK